MGEIIDVNYRELNSITDFPDMINILDNIFKLNLKPTVDDFDKNKYYLLDFNLSYDNQVPKYYEGLQGYFNSTIANFDNCMNSYNKYYMEYKSYRFRG
jgi:calcineurin-like phosphoesterase family protein